MQRDLYTSMMAVDALRLAVPVKAPQELTMFPESGSKIMVIDDDERVLVSVNRMLGRHGYSVLVHDGSPGSSGLEFARKVAGFLRQDQAEI